METIKLITITNYGYKDITKNSIISLQKINFDLSKVILYGMDDATCEYFKDCFKDLNVKRTMDYTNAESISYCEKGWKDITLQKIRVVYQELLKNDYVLLFDGDIVFNNINFISDLWSKINNDNMLEMLVQREYKADNDKELCSGFYLLKSTDNTKNVFNISQTKYPNDQSWLNSVKTKLKYQLLSNDLYPNGFYLYNVLKTIEHTHIMHFNFVKFPEKRGKMRRYKVWYV